MRGTDAPMRARALDQNTDNPTRGAAVGGGRPRRGSRGSATPEPILAGAEAMIAPPSPRSTRRRCSHSGHGHDDACDGRTDACGEHRQPDPGCGRRRGTGAARIARVGDAEGHPRRRRGDDRASEPAIHATTMQPQRTRARRCMRRTHRCEPAALRRLASRSVSGRSIPAARRSTRGGAGAWRRSRPARRRRALRPATAPERPRTARRTPPRAGSRPSTPPCHRRSRSAG